jgi:hypothetical protein
MSDRVVNDAPQPRRLGRSLGAVFAGMLAGIVLSIGTDMLLRKAGILPPLYQRASDAALLLATAYRALYSVLGSYIAAWLAPGRPMKHALMLGVIGVVATTVGTVVTWNRGPEFGPHWYPLALIGLAMPAAWAGGRLYRTRLDRRAHA